MDSAAYLPARSIRRIACGIEKPSKTGTACVTPSPESSTIPVVRPEEYLHLSAIRLDQGSKEQELGVADSQTEDGLDTGKECRDIEGLEKDLSCDITILTWIQWCFCKQYRVLLQISYVPPTFSVELHQDDGQYDG